MKEEKPRGTVLAALVHELVKAEPFDTYADLAAAVKDRAARLRLPYDAERVSAAIALVARTRPVFTTTARQRPLELPPDAPPISRHEAPVVLKRVYEHLR